MKTTDGNKMDKEIEDKERIVYEKIGKAVYDILLNRPVVETSGTLDEIKHMAIIADRELIYDIYDTAIREIGHLEQ